MKQKHTSKKSQDEAKSNHARLVVVGALGVVVIGAIVLLGGSLDDTLPFSASSQPAVVGAPNAGGPVAAPPGITNPTPYQYDAVTNRYYDPNHEHWHAGAPPLAGGGSTTPTEVPAPPGITNPPPYQYHAATDRPMAPTHAHRHSGPPPR